MCPELRDGHFGHARFKFFVIFILMGILCRCFLICVCGICWLPFVANGDGL